VFNKPLAVFFVAACLGSFGAASALADDAESTTVGGKAFIDFTNIDQQNDGVKQATNGTGIDVKRFYLIVNHKFDDMWSANLTTDFNYVSADNETQVFIKKAYLQAKLSEAFTARAGSADLPWVPFVESFYGYRYVEKVMLDRAGYGTSADWGLHAFGKAGDGDMFNYALSIVNGNGYKNPSRSKSVDLEGRAGVTPLPGLNFAVGFYNGKLGQDKQGLLPAAQPQTSERWDAVAAYTQTEFNVGAEYFQAKDWKLLSAQPTDKAEGYSAWGAYNFTPEVAVFGRYDQVKPSKDIKSTLKDTYFNVGVAYKPRKNVDFAVAYKYDKVENGAFKTADATLGTPAGREGKWREFGVWAQVGF
jgi:hypothetical protein